MSLVSLPVTRPIGRALIVGSAACRSQPLSLLKEMGFACAEADDPYTAMAELCRRPLVYRAMILSLQSVFREELNLITAVKRRFPHVEVWLTDLDGRQAALAEAMRLGADGLLGEDGLHRIATPMTGPMPPGPRGSPPAPPTTARPQSHTPTPPPKPRAAERPADRAPSPGPQDDSDGQSCEPVLTADELRALLHDEPPVRQFEDERQRDFGSR